MPLRHFHYALLIRYERLTLLRFAYFLLRHPLSRRRFLEAFFFAASRFFAAFAPRRQPLEMPTLLSLLRHICLALATAIEPCSLPIFAITPGFLLPFFVYCHAAFIRLAE